MIGAMAVAVAALASLGWGAAPASAAASCTWGGTPAAPTGTFTLAPGITNTPSTGPLDFRATGYLAGGAGCTGKLTFDGQLDQGSSCSTISFHGKVKGLPGVLRFSGQGPGPSAPSLLYDKHGSVVGYEHPVIQTLPGDSELFDCNTTEGFTHGHFSSVVELFADLW